MPGDGGTWTRRQPHNDHGVTNNHQLDAENIGETIFKIHEKIEHLQAQIYDLQNQNCEYEYRFKRMSLAADLRIPETRSSFYDGESMPWKMDD